MKGREGEVRERQVKRSGVKSRLRLLVLPVGWAKTLTATATAGDVTCVADNAPMYVHTCLYVSLPLQDVPRYRDTPKQRQQQRCAIEN